MARARVSCTRVRRGLWVPHDTAARGTPSRGRTDRTVITPGWERSGDPASPIPTKALSTERRVCARQTRPPSPSQRRRSQRRLPHQGSDGHRVREGFQPSWASGGHTSSRDRASVHTSLRVHPPITSHTQHVRSRPGRPCSAERPGDACAHSHVSMFPHLGRLPLHAPSRSRTRARHRRPGLCRGCRRCPCG